MNSFVKSYILKQFIKPKIQNRPYDYHFFYQFCDVFKLIKSYLSFLALLGLVDFSLEVMARGDYSSCVGLLAAVALVAERRLEAQAPGAADPRLWRRAQ